MKILKMVFVLSLLGIQIACASQRRGTVSSSHSDEVREKIREIQEEARIPGLQIAVTEDGKSVFEYLHGVRAQGHPQQVTSADKWHLGSCTKQMTAFLIGRLVDAKVVDWKTTIGEIVPADYEVDETVRGVTIEQLLSHRAGLVDVSEPEGGKLWPTLFSDKEIPQVMREKLVRGILKMPTRFGPGTKVEYSNSGYVVLGWIVEKRGGASWEATITRDLFGKVGMSSCGFGAAGREDGKSPRQPWPHVLEGDRPRSVPPGVNTDNPPAMGPAGTVHCSSEDWRKFLELFVDEQAVRSGHLSSSTYKKLLTKAELGPFTFSSFGRADRPWAKGSIYKMSGSNTLNYATVVIAPELKRIFTINTNVGHSKVEGNLNKIMEILIAIE